LEPLEYIRQEWNQLRPMLLCGGIYQGLTHNTTLTGQLTMAELGIETPIYMAPPTIEQTVVHYYEYSFYTPARIFRCWVVHESEYENYFRSDPEQAYFEACESYLLRMQDSDIIERLTRFNRSDFLYLINLLPFRFGDLEARFRDLQFEAFSRRELGVPWRDAFLEALYNTSDPEEVGKKRKEEIDCQNPECEYGIRIWSRLDRVYLPCSLCGNEN
jgi:hypothetical protein